MSVRILYQQESLSKKMHRLQKSRGRSRKIWKEVVEKGRQTQ